jgi:DNA-binding GntR family transcriptional regulator
MSEHKRDAIGQKMRSTDAPAPTSSGETMSLRDAAYEAIKHRIITCTYKPGQYLNEANVAAMLGIGRTPVQQAIDRLMLEGMVDVMPRKGVIVKPVSLDEIMQIIEVRLLNESYGVRLAAERADNDETRHLTDILARAAQWIEARNSEQLMLLDREYHGVLARASKNVVLADGLSKLHDRSLRFWFISLNRPGHNDNVHAQHEAILASIRDHDPDGAEQAMRAHILDFRENLMRSI